MFIHVHGVPKLIFINWNGGGVLKLKIKLASLGNNIKILRKLSCSVAVLSCAGQECAYINEWLAMAYIYLRLKRYQYFGG